jgi:hypothetical protein
MSRTNARLEEPIGVFAKRTIRELHRLAQQFRKISPADFERHSKDGKLSPFCFPKECAGRLYYFAGVKNLLPNDVLNLDEKCFVQRESCDGDATRGFEELDFFLCFEHALKMAPFEVAFGTQGEPEEMYGIPVWRVNHSESCAATCEWLADLIDDALASLQRDGRQQGKVNWSRPVSPSDLKRWYRVSSAKTILRMIDRKEIIARKLARGKYQLDLDAPSLPANVLAKFVDN